MSNYDPHSAFQYIRELLKKMSKNPQKYLGRKTTAWLMEEIAEAKQILRLPDSQVNPGFKAAMPRVIIEAELTLMAGINRVLAKGDEADGQDVNRLKVFTYALKELETLRCNLVDEMKSDPKTVNNILIQGHLPPEEPEEPAKAADAEPAVPSLGLPPEEQDSLDEY